MTDERRFRQISQNTIILALMYHYFGGDMQGHVHDGATPFETIHQFLNGMLPYIIESLYSYRSVTDVWNQFFKNRACTDVPEQKMMDKRRYPRRKKLYMEEIPITAGDNRLKQEKCQHWQQSRPIFEKSI